MIEPTTLEQYREAADAARDAHFAAAAAARMAPSTAAYAYHAANRLPGPYDRRTASDAYATRALSLYRLVHIKKGVILASKALGLHREGWWQDAIANLIYRIMRWRSRKVTQIPA